MLRRAMTASSAPAARVVGPAVAGTWYPGDATELAALVDRLLEGPGAERAQRPVRAIIVPHAGFAYSGPVAGLGFRRLPTDVDRVLLVGPTHYADFSGGCVPAATAYRTPLGDVPLDVGAIDRVTSSRVVHRDDGPFRPEHSLEAELPFLQRHLRPGWRVVPLLVGGGRDAAVLTDLATALEPVFDDRTLAVISSDFVHYGPRFGYVPFSDRIAERIREIDDSALERIVRLDGDGFRRYVQESGATICGRAAIEVLLQLLGPTSRGHVVAYDTSGRLTGDFRHSVSYASVLFS